MRENYIRDGAIVRYKKKTETKWNYEICTDNDLDNYYNTQSAYEHREVGGQILAETDWEVVFEGEINISKDMVKSLL